MPERSGLRPIYQVSTFNLLLYIYYSCKLVQSASIHRYTLYPVQFYISSFSSSQAYKSIALKYKFSNIIIYLLTNVASNL